MPPAESTLRKINWDTTSAIIGLHALSLLAFLPWLFDWTSLAITMALTPLFGLAINLCYHRQLAHRSFNTPLWLEHFFVRIALCCLQDTPAPWVANHRRHHKYADRPEDPHSPRVSFAWAHWGWLFIKDAKSSPLASYDLYAQDILRDPWYMQLERGFQREIIYLTHLGLLFLIGALVGWHRSSTGIEALRLGLSYIIWGGILRTVIIWHITWSVNSIAHVVGYQSHKTGDESRNNMLVGIISGGEGWHNNHHANPSCATTQRQWWEIDIAYYVICLLERLGLASNVNRSQQRQ